MFIQAKLKEHILSDLTTSKLKIVDPEGLPPKIRIFDMDGDEMEDWESIRHRLYGETEDPDEEWSTPFMKISKLTSDDSSWLDAKEIIDPPSAACHKIGDEVSFKQNKIFQTEYRFLLLIFQSFPKNCGDLSRQKWIKIPGIKAEFFVWCFSVSKFSSSSCD